MHKTMRRTQNPDELIIHKNAQGQTRVLGDHMKLGKLDMLYPESQLADDTQDDKTTKKGATQQTASLETNFNKDPYHNGTPHEASINTRQLLRINHLSVANVLYHC